MSAAQATWLIDDARVFALHALAVATWGGATGGDATCVERSIGASVSAALYQSEDAEGEMDPLTVAVHLCYYLARNHCFTDGNKRAAWMALIDQLASVGLGVDASQTEVVTLVDAVAQNTIGTAALHAWVALRLVAATDAPSA